MTVGSGKYSAIAEFEAAVEVEVKKASKLAKKKRIQKFLNATLKRSISEFETTRFLHRNLPYIFWLGSDRAWAKPQRFIGAHKR
jgi:hypothetical protein